MILYHFRTLFYVQTVHNMHSYHIMNVIYEYISAVSYRPTWRQKLNLPHQFLQISF